MNRTALSRVALFLPALLFCIGAAASDSDSLEVDPGALLWKLQIGSDPESEPTFADGVLYYAREEFAPFRLWSHGYCLYAVDLATRQRKWRAQLELKPGSSPQVGEEVTALSDSGGFANVVGTFSGIAVWRNKVGGAANFFAMDAGIVCFAEPDGAVSAFEAERGTAWWSKEVSGGINCVPVIAGSSVYVGTADGGIVALNAQTGDEIWRIELKNRLESAPIVSGGVVYCGFRMLYALDAAKGSEKWRVDLESPASASPAIADGVLYVGVKDGSLLALDAGTGAQKWRLEAADSPLGRPAVADAIVYFGCEDGNLYAVDCKKKEELWRFTTGGQIHAAPVIVDGVVYCSSWDGFIYAIRAGAPRE